MFSKPFLLEMNAQPGLLPVFVCHEIGHLLANDISSDDSVSPEGEADYFAGADCLKRVLKSHSDYFDAGVKFTALAKRFGDYLYQNVDHSKIYTSNRPSPHRTETITVGETIFGHPYPSLQCRLDSLIAGLNCAKSRFEIVNGRMAWISCNQNSPESSKAKNIKNDGMFPRCWYHP